MAVTNKDINALYLTFYNRMPEGNGQYAWLQKAAAENLNINQVAKSMLETEASQEYFAGKESSFDFIEHIYINLLGKDRTVDSEGISAWAREIDANGVSRSDVVVKILETAEKNVFTDPAAKSAQTLYLNKLKMAEFVAKTVDDVAQNGTIQEKVAPFTKMASDITADVSLVRALYETRSTAVKSDLVTPAPLNEDTSDRALEIFYDGQAGPYYQDLVNVFYLADEKQPFSAADEAAYISTKLSEVGFNGVTGISDPDASGVTLAGVNTAANADFGIGA